MQPQLKNDVIQLHGRKKELLKALRSGTSRRDLFWKSRERLRGRPARRAEKRFRADFGHLVWAGYVTEEGELTPTGGEAIQFIEAEDEGWRAEYNARERARVAAAHREEVRKKQARELDDQVQAKMRELSRDPTVLAFIALVAKALRRP